MTSLSEQSSDEDIDIENQLRPNSLPVTSEEPSLFYAPSKVASICLKRNVYLAALTIFSTAGGFLIGYDFGLVTGAMLLIDDQFNLSHFWHEFIVSSTFAAAAVASIFGIFVADLFGRKRALLLVAIFFIAGAVVLGASPNKEVLLVGRLIVGCGVGLASMFVPMYLAESAPAHGRGKIMVFYMMNMIVGVLIGSLIAGSFSEVAEGWRYMFSLAGVPSVIMFVGMLFMPETPRWLIYHKKPQKAKKSLARVQKKDAADEIFQTIVEDYEEYCKTKMSFIALLKNICSSRSVILALIVGGSIHMFKNLTGINAIMYYSGNVIKQAGFNNSQAIWFASIPTIGYLIFLLLGVFLIDRVGRRKLLFASLAGTIVALLFLAGVFAFLNERSPTSSSPYGNGTCSFSHCLFCVAAQGCGFCADKNSSEWLNGVCTLGVKDYSFYRSDNHTQCSPLNMSSSSDPTSAWFFDSCPKDPLSPLAIVGVFLYLMFFAPGMGPVPWAISSEIYPTWARSFGLGMSSFVNWTFSLIMSFSFLSLGDAVGPTISFIIMAGFGVTGFVFLFLMVPETKGKKLEEIESLFKKPYFLRWCSRFSRKKLSQKANFSQASEDEMILLNGLEDSELDYDSGES